MSHTKILAEYGIHVGIVGHNLPVAALYEAALKHEDGSQIASSGALVALSGEKTGRSPADKRIVAESSSEKDIWWGPVNIKLDDHSFEINLERARDYLNTRGRVYVVDGYAGWDLEHRLKVRVICARAYHALFMRNMLIRPSVSELKGFGEPDFVIYNAGQFPANSLTPGMSSKTSVDLCFARRQVVILGTEYAGEMKKGVFSLMHYLMPKNGVLSMHCSATESLKGGNTSVLFGLSGTGKTTLSADPKRRLIGDDEHCWTDSGLFNIEGGCYAKAIDLSEEQEPEIYRAIRFGTVLENVILDRENRQVDFSNTSITKNTRASYPIEFIPSAKQPCTSGHPNNVIFLTCDAFGVLPPVARLNSVQAMYHFISGYTAKVAGTEVGVTDPEATFSPCFGGPFLVWPPATYAALLAERIKRHGSQTWLVNTGWSGGGFGVGRRISLPITRAIVEAIHSGELHNAPVAPDPVFGFDIVTKCSQVTADILLPRKTWKKPQDYDATAKKLATLFRENFKKYSAHNSQSPIAGGPSL